MISIEVRDDCARADARAVGRQAVRGGRLRGPPRSWSGAERTTRAARSESTRRGHVSARTWGHAGLRSRPRRFVPGSWRRREGGAVW